MERVENEFSKGGVLIIANHYHGAVDATLIYDMYYKNNKNDLYEPENFVKKFPLSKSLQ